MSKLKRKDGKLIVPDSLTIPYISGDGTGDEITKVYQSITDKAIFLAYNGKKQIEWKEVYAGKKALELTGKWLPMETLRAFNKYLIGIKGPLDPSDNEKYPSINTILFQELDLYASLNPMRWFNSISGSSNNSIKTKIFIFKLTEQVSSEGCERLIKAAIQFAIHFKLPIVTLIHHDKSKKTLKDTYKTLGYKIADTEFPEITFSTNLYNSIYKIWGKEVAEEEYQKALLNKRIIIDDLKSDDLITKINNNRTFFSSIVLLDQDKDHLTKQLFDLSGSWDFMPKINFNNESGHIIFESSPNSCNHLKENINPTSLISASRMLLDYIGWTEASKIIENTLIQYYENYPAVLKTNTNQFQNQLLSLLEKNI